MPDPATLEISDEDAAFIFGTDEDVAPATDEPEVTPDAAEEPIGAAPEPEPEESDEKPVEEPEPEETPDESETEVEEDEPTDELDNEFPDLPEDETEKAQGTWKELKARTRTAESEAESLRAKVAELEAAVPSDETKTTIETLTKELESAKERLALQDFTQSDEYLFEVQVPLNDALDRVKAVTQAIEAAEEIPDYAAKVEAALLNQDRAAIKHLVAELDEFDRAEVMAEYGKVSQLNRRHQELEANLTERAKEFQSAKEIETQQQTIARQKAEREMGDSILERLGKKVPGLVDEAGSLLPEFKDVASYKDKLVEELPPEVQVASKFALPLLARYVKKSQADAVAKDAKIKELEDTISDLTKKPGAGSGSKKSEDVPDDEGDIFTDLQNLKASDFPMV